MKSDSQPVSKPFARQLMTAIEADYITSKEFVRWADRIIENLEHPPLWICELSVVQLKSEALNTIGEFVFSEPFEEIADARTLFLGFLWLRYERRELSWASFLKEGGAFADGGSSPVECEYFYCMLNELEEVDFAFGKEDAQAADVRKELDVLIKQAKEFEVEFRTA